MSDPFPKNFPLLLAPKSSPFVEDYAIIFEVVDSSFSSGCSFSMSSSRSSGSLALELKFAIDSSTENGGSNLSNDVSAHFEQKISLQNGERNQSQSIK